MMNAKRELTLVMVSWHSFFNSGVAAPSDTSFSKWFFIKWSNRKHSPVFVSFTMKSANRSTWPEALQNNSNEYNPNSELLNMFTYFKTGSGVRIEQSTSSICSSITKNCRHKFNMLVFRAQPIGPKSNCPEQENSLKLRNFKRCYHGSTCNSTVDCKTLIIEESPLDQIFHLGTIEYCRLKYSSGYFHSTIQWISSLP